MLPIAHIASALLANRVVELDDDPVPSVAGALVPDAVDKTLAWVLGATPTARHIGHTPFVAAGATLVAASVAGRRRAAAFGVAYLAHLLGDLTEGGHVPWLLPFKRYEVSAQRWQVRLTPLALALEAVGAAYIAFLARNGRWGGGPPRLAKLKHVQ